MSVCQYKIKLLFLLCILTLSLSGCSSGNEIDTNQLETEDMVPSPVDFTKFETVRKQEENGISYYNVKTAKEIPLPLDEWAKFEIASENGTAVPAYLQFVNMIKDTETISEHMKQYQKVKQIKTSFDPHPLNENDEYVLVHYKLLIGEYENAKKDRLSISALRFPLQLYSTMSNGTFGDDNLSERENSVMDVSIMNTGTHPDAGATIERTALYSIPKNNTAYGIKVPYQSADGTTQTLYFKLEYQ